MKPLSYVYGWAKLSVVFLKMMKIARFFKGLKGLAFGCDMIVRDNLRVKRGANCFGAHIFF
jgi:hypothetical protein